jgi:hypothetical protein
MSENENPKQAEQELAEAVDEALAEASAVVDEVGALIIVSALIATVNLQRN